MPAEPEIRDMGIRDPEIRDMEIRDMARRVAGRVLAERGLAASADRVAGIHVDVRPSGEHDRPAEEEAVPPDRRQPLVTARCLAGIERGGAYRVPPGAIVTDLAREEAWSRRITLAEGPTSCSDGGRLRVALGADHGGFAMKQAAIEWVRELGHLAIDLGTRDERPVDYPDFARAVAEAVAQGRADLGICVDGAGVGSAMAANKVPGVRAAMCYDTATARNAREHNHANVLTLGGRMIPARNAHDVVRAFLSTPVGGERHAKRVEKIAAIERSYARPSGAGPERSAR